MDKERAGFFGLEKSLWDGGFQNREKTVERAKEGLKTGKAGFF